MEKKAGHTDQTINMDQTMERLMHQGVDSRAVLAAYITKLPLLFLLAVAGAVLGSGINLLIAVADARETAYVSETEYYIEFTRYDVRDVYNAFTWNDAIATDLILGRAMELLGDGYERNHVKEMITADIFSDVRYLTITVRGSVPAEVEAVKNAIGTALEEFGTKKEEFRSIYKIEELEITQEEKQYFTWRAAFLGAVLCVGAGIFMIAFTAGMASRFYTKNDIMKILGLPACGLVFAVGKKAGKKERNKEENKKTADALTDRQQKMLEENLRRLLGSYSELALMDASGGRYATAFLQYVEYHYPELASGLKLYGAEGGYNDASDAAIIAVIPFGKTYREKITDEINHAAQQGGSVVAAVLTEADRLWTRIYYA